MHASKNTVWFDKYSSWQTAIRGGALYSESESKRFGLVAQNKSGMILILTKKKKKKKKKKWTMRKFLLEKKESKYWKLLLWEWNIYFHSLILYPASNLDHRTPHTGFLNVLILTMDKKHCLWIHVTSLKHVFYCLGLGNVHCLRGLLICELVQ